MSQPATCDLKTRLLYRSYALSSRIHHYLQRRVMPATVIIAPACLITFLLAIDYRKTSIYFLFFAASCALVCGLAWALLRRARISATRHTPRHGTVGEPLRYHVEVANQGGSSITNAGLAETLPDVRPGMADFAARREPGEASRNAFDRYFSYYRWRWLLIQNRPYRDFTCERTIHLRPGERTRIPLVITPARRGLIHLHDLRVCLPDPMGLFQKLPRIRTNPATIIVLPRRHPLPPFDMPGGSGQKIKGDATTNQIGNAGEFVGLRDYRPGDPPRQIHWKSWARLGKPIVKELEDTFFPRYGLLLDTDTTGEDRESFEAAVSTAASFVHGLDTGNAILDLMFVNGQAHVLTAGRGVQHCDKLLEVLATVQPDPSPDPDQRAALVKLVMGYRDDLASCLVILTGWDASRAAFLDSLRTIGVACVPLIISTRERDPAAPGHWLRADQLASDLSALPPTLRSI